MKNKKTFIYIICVLVGVAMLVLCSCCDSVSDKSDKRFVYDYDGKLVEKAKDGDNYLFIVEDLSDSTLKFTWKTSQDKYFATDTGTILHWDYLNKERLGIKVSDNQK